MQCRCSTDVSTRRTHFDVFVCDAAKIFIVGSFTCRNDEWSGVRVHCSVVATCSIAEVRQPNLRISKYIAIRQMNDVSVSARKNDTHSAADHAIASTLI